MELKTFEKYLDNNNGLSLNEELILFKNLELYNLTTDTSENFDDLDSFYKYVYNGQTMESLINGIDQFVVTYDGGRGSGSSNSEMGGGFTSADQRGRKSEDYGATQFPARLNTETGGRYKSYEKTLQKFERMYKDANVEYGASIDDQGFATRLIKGGSTSVPISGGRGEMIVHNHPSGGNFSKQDLISIAKGSEKGIVAVGSNVNKNRMRYTITKSKNFKSNEFVKAVNKAQWPKNLSYDDGADWWLRRNAKTYGYKYSAKKIK